MANVGKTTPFPVVHPIAMGIQCGNSKIYAWRPDGIKDWVFSLTLDGEAVFRNRGQSLQVRRGDFVGIKPGTPHDYGIHPDPGLWHDIWIHVNPRSHWLEWLDFEEPIPGHLHRKVPDSAMSQIENILRQAEGRTHGHSVLGLEWAMHHLEEVLLKLRSQRLSKQPADQRIMKVVAHLSENYRQPPDLLPLARMSGLSRSRFFQLFQREVGLTPGEFIERQRLERAAHLLMMTNLRISEIAEQHGFNCPFYFSLRFKKLYGQSPKAFRLSQGGKA